MKRDRERERERERDLFVAIITIIDCLLFLAYSKVLLPVELCTYSNTNSKRDPRNIP